MLASMTCLTTETVQSAWILLETTHRKTEAIVLTPLSFESIYDIKGCDGLALRMLGVCNSVPNDTLEEGLQNSTGLFIDHCKSG